MAKKNDLQEMLASPAWAEFLEASRRYEAARNVGQLQELDQLLGPVKGKQIRDALHQTAKRKEGQRRQKQERRESALQPMQEYIRNEAATLRRKGVKSKSAIARHIRANWKCSLRDERNGQPPSERTIRRYIP